MPSPPSFTFLGCYSDRDPIIRNGRDRVEPRRGPRTMLDLGEGVSSLEACNQLASDAQYAFFAMQHNHHCYGSNERNFDHYSQEPNEDCFLECTGVGGQGERTQGPECGGAWRNAVYETKTVARVSTPPVPPVSDVSPVPPVSDVPPVPPVPPGSSIPSETITPVVPPIVSIDDTSPGSPKQSSDSWWSSWSVWIIGGVSLFLLLVVATFLFARKPTGETSSSK